MINRPPIKNNLNEQLKIYYAYRDEQIQNRLNNNEENRSLNQLTFRHIPDQPPHVRRQTILSQILLFNTQRDSIPLKKIDKLQQSSPVTDVSPSAPNRFCPLCQIPFDTAGIHRPLTDACGHTTCFQCFKEVMIKATGCSLCQKEEEEEMNSQVPKYTPKLFMNSSNAIDCFVS